MPDVLQRSVQALAYTDTLTRDIAIFCARVLLFVLVVAWLLVVYRRRAGVTRASLTRIVLLLGMSYIIAKLVSHVINDPRPYLVQQIQPLIPLAQDNGFPSDHSLLAWALAFSLVWLAPGAVWPFSVVATVVMLGRLGVAAHHSLDVAGSALIVIVVALLLGRLPLPASWHRPIFANHRWPPFLRIA